jgi:hypothetical protein
VAVSVTSARVCDASRGVVKVRDLPGDEHPDHEKRETPRDVHRVDVGCSEPRGASWTTDRALVGRGRTLETIRSCEGSSWSTSTSVRRTCAASAVPTLPLVAT